jgi:GNAT superfamily N-acetyltransferase
MVRLALDEGEVGRCFEVMLELRPSLKSAEQFLELVREQQGEGYLLAYLEDGDDVVTVAGFRVQRMLSSGLTLYVDDLVTGAEYRSKGYGKVMLDWLVDQAKERGCDTFSLDSGTQRQEAHAFYFREGMRVTSFHFAKGLKGQLRRG